MQAAERDAALAAERLELADAAVKAAQLEGEMRITSATDAQEVAGLDAPLAAGRADRLRADLRAARRRLGNQVPVDEIIFIPSLPVRVKQVTSVVGDVARGPVLSVTDNLLAVDSALPLDVAPLVKPGMRVAIDEQALGIKATGRVKRVANTPGTRGVDGYHFYFEIGVDETPTPLEGFSLRLTIPIESTDGEVTVVPMSAISLSADGTSRIQVQRNGKLEYVGVEPGLSADGYVEVVPVEGALSPEELVVVGYDMPGSS